MPATDLSVSRLLCGLFDASPTPYHTVATAVSRLDEAGFAEIGASDVIPAVGRNYWRSGGALVAWSSAPHHDSESGFRVIGAHTDSPNLRVKPNPDTGGVGWLQLGVEIYGGVLLNSWLDRDLGLAGRVAIRGSEGPESVLFRDDRPILRIPQLAIHLDGDIREKGLLLNRQTHMAPVWGLGSEGPSFVAYLASRIETEPDDILGWDVMAHDLTPATIGGLEDEFLISARIDNQLSCFLAVEALAAVAEQAGPRIPMICLFDHEEVGSVSTTGAASPLLGRVIERLGAAHHSDAEARARSRADSLVVSADGAHATHPNYVDRHEAEHRIALNGGPVLKVNSNQRYATDALTGATFRLACEAAGVPMQTFVTRTDLGCGSTIGPATAGQLGIGVVDAGCAQLAMHSAREMAGSADPAWFAAALEEVLKA